MVVSIVFEKKLDEVIAEPANAVVENNRVGFRKRHNTSDRAE
jgi:hypothetical protein